MEVKGKKEVVSIDHLKPAFFIHLRYHSQMLASLQFPPNHLRLFQIVTKLLLTEVVMYTGRNIFPTTVSGGGIL